MFINVDSRILFTLWEINNIIEYNNDTDKLFSNTANG